MPIKQSNALGANDYNGNDKRLRGGSKDKNNVDDNNSMITIRQNDEFTSALSIISIKQFHAGEYTCRVQNDAALVQYSAVLKVNGIFFFLSRTQAELTQLEAFRSILIFMVGGDEKILFCINF